MFIIIVATQYSLCFLSMLLTGLFCIDVSSAASISESNKVYSVAAMLAVGVGFDLSKYIFWNFRYESKGYLINCLALVLFSWSASVAFFVSHEQSRTESIRHKSKTYQAHQIEINSIKAQIQQKTVILESRVNSKFHEQWDKAETLADDIQQLQIRLKNRINELDQVGRADVNDTLVTTALFQYVSSLLNVSAGVVAIFIYGILAFLIESCSLGIISLSSSMRKKLPDPEAKHKSNAPKNQLRDTVEIGSIREKQQRLRNDIVSGKTEPVLRRIRKSNYKLSEKYIREVLAEMKEQGLLVDGPRSLKLVKDGA